MEALNASIAPVSPPDSLAVDTLVTIVLTLVSKPLPEDVRCESGEIPVDELGEAAILKGRIVEEIYNFCSRLPGDHARFRIVVPAQCLFNVCGDKEAYLHHFPEAIPILQDIFQRQPVSRSRGSGKHLCSVGTSILGRASMGGLPKS